MLLRNLQNSTDSHSRIQGYSFIKAPFIQLVSKELEICNANKVLPIIPLVPIVHGLYFLSDNPLFTAGVICLIYVVTKCSVQILVIFFASLML